MNSKAGYNFSTSLRKLFKFPTSANTSNPTSMEGSRFIYNENFQLTENELRRLETVIEGMSCGVKPIYRNSLYAAKNYVANSDFKDWNNGNVFNFDNSGITIQIADNWKLYTSNSKGSLRRQSFEPNYQVDVPENPDYFLDFYLEDYEGTESYIETDLIDPQDLNAQQMVLSFYGKATENGLNIEPKVIVQYNDGLGADVVLTGTTQVMPTGAFARKQNVQFFLPSDITTRMNSQLKVKLRMYFKEHGNSRYLLSSFQMEIGTLSTPYKRSAEVQHQDIVLVDTSSSAFTLKLKATPNVGDTCKFIDIKGSFAVNNLTIDRNGKKILGTTNNLKVSTKYSVLEMMYVSDDYGWSQLNYNSEGKDIPFYEDSIVYGFASLVKKKDTVELYQSLQPNNAGHPLTDTAWWRKVLDFSNLQHNFVYQDIGTAGGVVKLTGIIPQTLKTGDFFIFIAANNNTGASTIQLDPLFAATGLQKNNGITSTTNLIKDDIVANKVYIAIKQPSNLFVLVNPETLFNIRISNALQFINTTGTVLSQITCTTAGVMDINGAKITNSNLTPTQDSDLVPLKYLRDTYAEVDDSLDQFKDYTDGQDKVHTNGRDILINNKKALSGYSTAGGNELVVNEGGSYNNVRHDSSISARLTYWFLNNANTKIGRIEKSTDTGTFAMYNGTGTGMADVAARALQAQFADFGEYYITDGKCEPGNIVELDYTKEVTTLKKANKKSKIVGVVSINPGMVINSAIKEEENTLPIAYNGLVKILIKGNIKKGDNITLHKNGIGKKAILGKGIAISLQTVKSKGITLIDCILL